MWAARRNLGCIIRAGVAVLDDDEVDSKKKE